MTPSAGGAGVTFADLIGGKQFDLKLDPKAPLKDPATYTLVGKPLPRPDVPAKMHRQLTSTCTTSSCRACCTAA